MMLNKTILLILLSIASSSLSAVENTKTVSYSDDINLKQIMSDPDWMGSSPRDYFWSENNQYIFYSKKVKEHTNNDHFRVKVNTQKNTRVENSNLLYRASQKAVKNPAGNQGVFAYQNDIYWVDFLANKIKPIIVDEAVQSKPQFISASKISYFVGHKIYFYNLVQGYAQQVAGFETKADPEAVEDKNYLEQSQPRLLTYLDKKISEKEYQKQQKTKNNLSKNKTWYLGKGVEIRTFSLSPTGDWLVLGTVKKDLAGKSDHMPEFVTLDGYVNDREVRPLVGSSKPTNEKFYLVDLIKHKKYSLNLAKLPGINDDPLEKLKKQAAQKLGYKYKELEEPRAVYAYNWSKNGGVEWSQDGTKAALLLFSYDNKDRWIISVAAKSQELRTLHWLTDQTWVNDWSFNDFGWLPDHKTFYYLSEEDGYSHLYIKKGKRRAKQITKGKFEVSDLTLSKNGKYFYFKANKNHPGNYEIYRISSKGGVFEELSALGGVNNYVLSPSEKQLLIEHSNTTSMPELYVKNIKNKKSTQLTDSASEAFKAIKWQAPKIVKVPSSHMKRPIYSRLYPSQSKQRLDDSGKKPAVIFVHGAGYLQNAHQGWSGYFREFMFHNLLTREGYTVLDMDYRASKGYGRDWRTAIYRNMGTPELEDLTDGVQWLVKNANVDPKRIGIYGGSYGGFMAFMALFKAPEVFAAGAALRPVTDWAHYNHGYTSNILNTPQVDPDAYARSSPIEFAQGLNKPLLIAHGMVDDNVFFKDTVRLVQRLIELEKTPYFETAIYPVEPHGFKQPSSWLDEYTRIYQLFERHLN